MGRVHHGPFLHHLKAIVVFLAGVIVFLIVRHIMVREHTGVAFERTDEHSTIRQRTLLGLDEELPQPEIEVPDVAPYCEGRTMTNRVALIVVNYNLPERTDSIIHFLRETVMWPLDYIVVDDASDTSLPSKHTTLYLTEHLGETNAVMAGLDYADGLAAARMDCYYAYWVWKTNMQPVPSPGVDILEVLMMSLLGRAGAVGISPTMHPRSPSVWAHMRTSDPISPPESAMDFGLGTEPGPGRGVRSTWLLGAGCTLWRAPFLDAIGRLERQEALGFGAELEQSYLARRLGRSLLLHDHVTVMQDVSVGVIKTPPHRSPLLHRGGAATAAEAAHSANMQWERMREQAEQAYGRLGRVLLRRYGPDWLELMDVRRETALPAAQGRWTNQPGTYVPRLDPSPPPDAAAAAGGWGDEAVEKRALAALLLLRDVGPEYRPPVTTTDMDALIDVDVAALVTIGIHHFLRPEQLRRQLHSISASYPGITVLVADDSGGMQQMLRLGDEFPLLHIHHFLMPVDSGVSAGRNLILSQTTTPYVVFCDAHFTFPPQQSLKMAVSILQSSDFDVLGGVLTGPNAQAGSMVQQQAVSFARPASRQLHTCVGESYGVHVNAQGVKVVHTDSSLDLFVARCELLREVGGWDVQLKTSASNDLFWRLKGVAKVGFWESFQVVQSPLSSHTPPSSPTELAAAAADAAGVGGEEERELGMSGEMGFEEYQGTLRWSAKQDVDVELQYLRWKWGFSEWHVHGGEAQCPLGPQRAAWAGAGARPLVLRASSHASLFIDTRQSLPFVRRVREWPLLIDAAAVANSLEVVVFMDKVRNWQHAFYAVKQLVEVIPDVLVSMVSCWSEEEAPHPSVHVDRPGYGPANQQQQQARLSTRAPSPEFEAKLHHPHMRYFALPGGRATCTHSAAVQLAVSQSQRRFLLHVVPQYRFNSMCDPLQQVVRLLRPLLQDSALVATAAHRALLEGRHNDHAIDPRQVVKKDIVFVLDVGKGVRMSTGGNIYAPGEDEVLVVKSP